MFLDAKLWHYCSVLNFKRYFCSQGLSLSDQKLRINLSKR